MNRCCVGAQRDSVSGLLCVRDAPNKRAFDVVVDMWGQ